ncbi:hypothetical protein GGG16DRAFT_117388 [Schizophyllum commune]
MTYGHRCDETIAGAETIATVPDDSIFTPAMVEPHLGINPGSSGEIRECSPQSAKDDGGETTGLVPDSDGQVQVSQSSAENLTLSSSATPCTYATRVPSDETSDRSSPESCKPALHLRSPTIPSKFPAPLLWSSHWAAAESGLDNTNRRVRGWPAASSLRESTNLGGARNMKWLSPRLDAADTAAPSASQLPFDAFGRGPVLESLEDGMSDLKRGHAGGQAVLSSCKDVKPPDVREGKKDPPQFIASGSKGQRSPSSKLIPATPRTYGRGAFALRCSGSSVGDGREVLCCSPDSLPLSAREAETVEQPYESGSGAKDEVSFFNGRGDNSPVNTAWDFGRGTHARDSEAGNVFALPLARAPPDIAGVGDVNMPS